MPNNRTKTGKFIKGTSGNPNGRPKKAAGVDPSPSFSRQPKPAATPPTDVDTGNVNIQELELDTRTTQPINMKRIPSKSAGDNAPSPGSSIPNTVVGAAGTIVFNGFIVDEEYNQDLTYIKGLQMWDRMRKSDATVKEALSVVKLPILGANWRVQAASDDPQDQLKADFIEYNLFEVMAFDDFLRQVLGMLEFGFSVFEIIYDMIQFNGKTYLGLQELAWRKQTTIWQWALDDGSFGVKQFVPGGVDGGFKQIPGDKIILFTNEREGDNYSGLSILRSAYKHWYMKEAMYKIAGIAAEKNSIGTPVVTVPVGARPEDIEMMRQLAQNYRANEGAYLQIPEGWTWTTDSGNTKRAFDMIPWVNHHDAKILSTVLAQFLNIGQADQSGSYGLSKDQSALFIESIQWVAKYVAEVINEELIPKLIDLNFSDTESYPALSFERIGDDNLMLYSTLLPALVTSDLLTPTPEDEEHVRKMINFPDMPDSGLDDEEGNNLPSVDAQGNPIEKTPPFVPNSVKPKPAPVIIQAPNPDPTQDNAINPVTNTPKDPGETNQPPNVDPKFAKMRLVRNRALDKILAAEKRKRNRSADLRKLAAENRAKNAQRSSRSS